MAPVVCIMGQPQAECGSIIRAPELAVVDPKQVRGSFPSHVYICSCANVETFNTSVGLEIQLREQLVENRDNRHSVDFGNVLRTREKRKTMAVCCWKDRQGHMKVIRSLCSGTVFMVVMLHFWFRGCPEGPSPNKLC